MKEVIKNILKGIGLYHPLQSFYRNVISSIREKRYRSQYRQFAGSGFTCNVCGAQYSKFVADYPVPENRQAIARNKVIAGYGENIICPNCLSTARERLVIAFLQQEIDLSGKRVLHLSPEKNVYHFIKEKATITTADLLPGFYKTIDGMVQKQDATRFSFTDNSFDLVIANHILEHIPDDRQAMREIFRVMKPGAMAVLQVPYSEIITATMEEPSIDDPVRQSLLYGQKDHLRIYAFNDYVQRLLETGFMVDILGEDVCSHFKKFAIQEGEKFLKVVKPKNK